jgi:M6 family metalloprotease-like protein
LVKSGQGAQIQNYLAKIGICVKAMRIPESKLSNVEPKTKQSDSAALASTNLCKIENAERSNNWKGFPSASRLQDFTLKKHPSPNTIMQIVPIYSVDAPVGKGSPYDDYKFYFEFIMQYFNYIDDSSGSFELRIPDSYIKFPKAIGDYGITHGVDNDLSQNFVNDVVSTVDPMFDFRQITYTLIVVPAGTPSDILGQQGFGMAKSADGAVVNISTAQPATFTFADNNMKTRNMVMPTMWLHEFYHPGLNLGDNHAGDSFEYDAERGMGDWGLMSRNSGDLLAWQKWLLGFVTDEQVRCVLPTSSTSYSWLAPSSTKTQHPKLVVVPLSKNKAIVVESIRATGLHYRLNSESLGALAYVVDAGDPRHEYGYSILYPDKRKPKFVTNLMSDGPLKVGESLTYEGVKITNVEWGEFGDVIKVESIK